MQAGWGAPSLLQLGFLLLGRPAFGARHARVGGAREDVPAVGGALAQGGPAFGVVVLHGRRVGGGGRDVVLEGAEVVEDVGYAGLPERVYCLWAGMSELPGQSRAGGAKAMWPSGMTYIRP